MTYPPGSTAAAGSLRSELVSAERDYGVAPNEVEGFLLYLPRIIE